MTLILPKIYTCIVKSWECPDIHNRALFVVFLFFVVVFFFIIIIILSAICIAKIYFHGLSVCMIFSFIFVK